MSSKKSPAGRAAGTAHDPKPTDRDSLRDAPAALCESGAEGISGASPSNTAPHNSNTALPDGFRLLRLAVDSLYLSFPGELNAESFSALQKLKVNAQSENLELVDVNYPDRSATTILAGGSGE